MTILDRISSPYFEPIVFGLLQSNNKLDKKIVDLVCDYFFQKRCAFVHPLSTNPQSFLVEDPSFQHFFEKQGDLILSFEYTEMTCFVFANPLIYLGYENGDVVGIDVARAKLIYPFFLCRLFEPQRTPVLALALVGNNTLLRVTQSIISFHDAQNGGITCKNAHPLQITTACISGTHLFIEHQGFDILQVYSIELNPPHLTFVGSI